MPKNGLYITIPTWLFLHNICFVCRHPDKNKNENAEDKFVEINKAYEVSLFKHFACAYL